MNFHFIASTAILFFMVMDPFGNMPVFVNSLARVRSERFNWIVLRECVFALVAMLIGLVAGRWFMGLMRISPGTLRVAGGIILFMMGLKMVFSTFIEERYPPDHEPFIVPLAIPLICGPGILAMLMTVRGSVPAATLPGCLAALLVAWVAQTLLLLKARFLARVIGNKALDSLESLMGLLLTCIAVSLFLEGLNAIYGLTPRM